MTRPLDLARLRAVARAVYHPVPSDQACIHGEMDSHRVQERLAEYRKVVGPEETLQLLDRVAELCGDVDIARYERDNSEGRYHTDVDGAIADKLKAEARAEAWKAAAEELESLIEFADDDFDDYEKARKLLDKARKLEDQP